MMPKVFLSLLSLLIVPAAFSQVAVDSDLFRQLQKGDSVIFEQGFNNCNFVALEKVVHADLQFIHDQGGMQNRAEFFSAVKNNICAGNGPKPVRQLTNGTLQVFPLMNNGKLYGAVQMGIHEFYLAEPGKELRFTSGARFIHTWLLENGEWKLFRVISYDHQPVKIVPRR